MSADKKAAESTADQPFDMSGVVNDEDPTTTLGALDLGDEVEDEIEDAPVEEEEAPVEEPEPEEEEAPVEEPEGEEEEAPVEEPESEEDEAPVEAPEAPKAKQPSIPKARFDQRTAQLRAVERELAEAQRKIQEAETARQKAEREASTMSDEQLQAKMTEANAALIDGDTEKAAKLQSEVFKAMRSGQEASGEPAPQVDATKIAADVRDQMLFEQTLTDIGTRYPALDENHASFDEAMSEEAVSFQQMYFGRGYTRAEATAKAAEAVAKIHGLADTATPAPAPTTKAAMAKASQAAARKGKVAAAKKAPPALGGSSGANADSADSVDIDALSVEDWSALPDSVRSRLLGD